MELYFNPYPGAVQSIETGTQLIVDVADALHRLEKDLQNIPLTGKFADFDVRPSNFILVREARGDFRIQDIIFKVKSQNHEKLQLLLLKFSKGKVIDSNEMNDIENWVVSNIGAPAPILEFAAKNKAIALTIPTELEWRVDRIEFNERDEFLHNLWGQEDLSQLKDHCVNALTNVPERFSARYGAKFCDGALNSAPAYHLWERLGFFQNMDKAKEREYEVDSDLVKNVGDTKYGTLLELRCHGQGQRIFFVFRKNANPRILVGGFDRKSGGVNQNAAIKDACERINKTHFEGIST